MKKIILIIFSFCIVQIGNSQGSNTAIDCNGINSYINYGNRPDFNSLAAFTMSCWINLDSYPSNNYTPMGKEQAYRFVISSTGYLHVAIATTNKSWYSSGSTAGSGGYQIDLNNWHFITAVYDGLNTKLYIDGELKGTSGPVTGTTKNNSYFLFNGHNVNHSTVSYTNGQFDESRLWNIALTQSEIQQNMCRKLIGNEIGLIAYYRMDEGVDNTCSGGQDVCDLTGNGNHGVKY